QEVLERIGYDPDRDLENTADSVFCSHGAGFVVPWYEADGYMHLDSGLGKVPETDTDGEVLVQNEETLQENRGKTAWSPGASTKAFLADDKELEAIFRRTYGESKRERARARQMERQPEGAPL